MILLLYSLLRTILVIFNWIFSMLKTNIFQCLMMILVLLIILANLLLRHNVSATVPSFLYRKWITWQSKIFIVKLLDILLVLWRTVVVKEWRWLIINLLMLLELSTTGIIIKFRFTTLLLFLLLLLNILLVLTLNYYMTPSRDITAIIFARVCCIIYRYTVVIISLPLLRLCELDLWPDVVVEWNVLPSILVIKIIHKDMICDDCSILILNRRANFFLLFLRATFIQLLISH